MANDYETGRRSARTWRTLALIGCLGVTPACVGNIGDAPGHKDGAGDSAVDPGLDVASAGIRRMTPAQYQNTARDLFGDPDLELALDADVGQAVTLLGAEKLNGAADFIVSRSDSWTADVFPCDTSGEGTSACADELIEGFGRRAFRRPLSADERGWLRAVFDGARGEQTFRDSLLIVIKVILQSPQHIYFLELGQEPTAGLPAGIRPLSGWERASRLSYFLWNTTPDDELLAAAEAGALDTPEGVAAQAERLMADPRVRATVRDLFVDWLELDGTETHTSLEEGVKSPDLFPEDSPALRAAMRTEIEALVERVFFEEEGTVAQLVTTTDAYVNGPLADLYGVDGPADEESFAWVKLPEGQRAGIFTRAAFLSMNARGDVKSPIRRGAFLLKEALCVKIGKPPPNANDTPITGGSVEENGETVHRTVRQDVEAKTTGGVCTTCHSLINPVGFAFENFDALGRWQTVEEGEDASGPFTLPIDATGGLPVIDEHGLPSPGQPDIEGAVAMSKAIAGSAGLTTCMSSRWFEAALRRPLSEQDQRTADALEATLDGGATLRDVVATMVASDAFLYLRPSED